MIRTTKYDGFAGCAWALSDYDTKPGLGGIKNPILCICGTKDQAYPGIQAIHAAVPGSKLVNIEGAGHICNVEQPDNFTKTIRDFIKG
jgi:3-oxoadipate enol-lactonase